MNAGATSQQQPSVSTNTNDTAAAAAAAAAVLESAAAPSQPLTPVRIERYDTGDTAARIAQNSEHPCQKSAQQAVCQSVACLHTALQLTAHWVDLLDDVQLPKEREVVFGKRYSAVDMSKLSLQ
jgi:hypothetical protein